MSTENLNLFTDIFIPNITSSSCLRFRSGLRRAEIHRTSCALTAVVLLFSFFHHLHKPLDHVRIIM
jgi:hypothetical protein